MKLFLIFILFSLLGCTATSQPPSHIYRDMAITPLNQTLATLDRNLPLTHKVLMILKIKSDQQYLNTKLKFNRAENPNQAVIAIERKHILDDSIKAIAYKLHLIESSDNIWTISQAQIGFICRHSSTNHFQAEYCS